MSDINDALGVNAEENQNQQRTIAHQRPLSTDNGVAIVLRVIGYFTFIAGFIAGITFANATVPTGVGTMFESTRNEFSWTIAITWWGIALISGVAFIGFAEIIKLLQGIKNNVEAVRTGMNKENL